MARAKKLNVTQPVFPFDGIIVVDDANARTNYDGIEELAADIQANGLLEPIGLKLVLEADLTDDQRELLGLEEGDKAPSQLATLTYGFRRYYSIQHIRSENEDAFTDVPFVLDEGNELDSVFKNLNENIARKDLTPGELADAFYKLRVNMKLSVADIMIRVPTYSKAYIQGLISLRKKLSSDAWEKFHAGDMTYDVAREVAKAGSKTKQGEVLKAVDTATKAATKTKGGKPAKKKRGVKQAAQAASKKASGKEDASPRPSLKQIKEMAKVYEERDTEKPYNKGVAYAIAWVLGDRKRIPNLKSK